jgi:protein-tyrosine sulfotransferase
MAPSLQIMLEHLYEKLINSGWYKDNYFSASNPVIIGGSPRSGTTLLRVMLDSHKNIYIGPETGLLYTNLLNNNKLGKISTQLDVSPEKIRSIKKESLSNIQFIDSLFTHLQQKAGKHRWGEKSPRNVTVIGRLFKYFPESRFIHIIRDGRDVACSLRHFPKHKIVDGNIVKLDTNNPIDQCISTWIHNVKLGLAWRSDPRYLEIKYEDLVSNPKHTMTDVLDFIDEPWDEDVLNYYLVDSATRSIDKIPQNIRARKPIDKSALARWKRDLSKEEQELFKKMAGDLLVELGYEQDSGW